MHTLILILAWTSFLIGGAFFTIVTLFGLLILIAQPKHVGVKVGPSFFVFLALFVWPIIYYFC